MIVAKLKESFHTAESITLEFTGLMRSTFAYYSELQAHFHEQLPEHLHQSQLISLLNADIKPRLFNHPFCERIQESLKALRRAIIRLEDFRAAHPELPEYVNNLETLSKLGERVEALYQKHWEYYRYQSNVTEQELVAFLLEVDRIGYEWDVYLEGFSAAGGLVRAMGGEPPPENTGTLRVAYQRAHPAHYAVQTLTSLMDFLRACYRFICAAHDLDAEAQPLTMLQVEIGDPVEMQLAVPQVAAESYRKFLQYLFLKDMLHRETLLKFVMEAILREYRPGGALAPAALQSHQKEISARLKALPPDGRFTISDRTFPDDGVRVMHEFIVALEERSIPHDALIQAGEKGKRSGRVRKSAKAGGTFPESPAPQRPEARPEAGSQPRTGPRPAPRPGEELSPGEKEHIRILTDKELEYSTAPER
ncbi:MAG: hypothetical protein O7A67_00420 [SAR324 cluster bacterium]|nr:hypothetical protein [SAR324 cluster bacterium]